MSQAQSDAGGRGPSHRSVEIGFAVFTMIVAATTIAGSARVGIGWGVEGPKAGFFPFYVGAILLAASLANLVRSFADHHRRVFAEWGQLSQVVSVAVPTAIYVLLVPYIGIYVASGLLIGAFMKWLGKYRWPMTILISLAVPAVTYVMFERWFLVTLPKGPIESLLGL